MERDSIKEIYAIGHSAHSIDEFIALLKAHAIERVVDVIGCVELQKEAIF